MTEILLVLQQLIASGTHIIGKGLTLEVDPPVVLFFRAIIASSVFFMWIMFRGGFRKIDLKDIPTLFILGALNIPINQFLFLTGIKLTKPPNIALAYALTPAFVLVIAKFFLKEKMNLKKILGIIIAFAGTVIVLAENGFDLKSDYFIGDLCGLAASFSWAFYTVIGKKFSTKYGAIYSTGLTMMTGLLLYIPIFYLLPVTYELSDISAVNWMQLAYLGIMTSGVAYALWYYALTKSDAGKVAVFNNLQTIFTTILSIIFFSQVLTWYFVVGGLLVIGGVYTTQKAD